MKTAQCNCGQLIAYCEDAPERLSVCHCLNCKRRTGSAFSYNATFDESRVRLEGQYHSYTRDTDSGHKNTYLFCPGCGSTVIYRVGLRPGKISVPAGAFSDPDYPAPKVELFENRRHFWCHIDLA